MDKSLYLIACCSESHHDAETCPNIVGPVSPAKGCSQSNVGHFLMVVEWINVESDSSLWTLLQTHLRAFLALNFDPSLPSHIFALSSRSSLGLKLDYTFELALEL